MAAPERSGGGGVNSARRVGMRQRIGLRESPQQSSAPTGSGGGIRGAVFTQGAMSAWLRPADTDPPAILVVAHSAAGPVDPARGATSPMLPALLADGFSLFSDPDTPLPGVRGLSAWHTAGHLTVYDEYGIRLWDGRLPTSQAWTYAAMRIRQLGVVIATDVDLTDQGQARALYSAITSGRAVGATVALAEPGTAGQRRRRSQTTGGQSTTVPAMRGPFSSMIKRAG